MGIVTHARNRRDADLEAAIALPDGAGTVNSASIDLGAGDVHISGAEIDIHGPVLAFANFGNGDTMVYDLQTSTDDDTFTDLYSAVLTQTGAGGVGAAAADVRVGVGSEMARYLRVQITLTGTGNNSGVNGEIRLLT